MNGHDNLPARVAALELLVEQMILERVQQTDSPCDAVRAALGGITRLATQREDVPMEAIGAAAEILAAVILRLGTKE
ncbi:hypothetical protein M5E06_21080 [Azospirillum sp. A1-3]|uniref:hypothetical protein n=1 Tax=Azospirillum sp. A1-3 TaxID=185874 RepID=UPI0020774C81|nr:hypothetical protein [Azospirillum sp. A1-3]MCM8736624.1 hypothetical protein [Azospirillum sp. A1-3]